MKRDPADDLRSLDRLGRELRLAAEREMGSPRGVRGRRRRRTLVAVVASVLGLAAVAGAARIIAVGEPVPPLEGVPERFAPPDDGAGSLVLTSRDPGGPLPFGARIYSSDDGLECIIAGRLRARTLGVVEAGRFRPFADNAAGSCGRLSRTPVFFTVRPFLDGPPRSVVFGRAADSVPQLEVRTSGDQRTIRPAEGGAFLLVFEGRVDDRSVSVRRSPDSD